MEIALKIEKTINDISISCSRSYLEDLDFTEKDSYFKNSTFLELTEDSFYLDQNSKININNYSFLNMLYKISKYCVTFNVNIYARVEENILHVYMDNSSKYVHKNSINSLRLMKEFIELQDNKFNSEQCQGCKAEVRKEDINTIINSMGEELRVCNTCIKRSVKCQCGVKEIVNLTKVISDIDDNGNNIRIKNCKKCHINKNLKHCKLCMATYDTDINDVCICQIPSDFQKLIRPWNADVTETLPFDVFTKELFGVEIEAGIKIRNRKSIIDVYNHTHNLVSRDAILKYDSSIDFLDGSAKENPNDYRGFEIVTRPMSYKNSIRFLNNLSSCRHPMLKSWEVGTTGIHIHVSKSCLTKIQRGKLLLFINDVKNRNFIKTIAKREDKKYAKYLKRKLTDFQDMNKDCHYYALNTSKEATFEFRMFRGTLNPVTLISYLEFIKSLIEFIRVVPNGIAKSSEENNITYNDYCNWLFSTEKSRFRKLKSRLTNELSIRDRNYETLDVLSADVNEEEI